MQVKTIWTCLLGGYQLHDCIDDSAPSWATEEIQTRLLDFVRQQLIQLLSQASQKFGKLQQERNMTKQAIVQIGFYKLVLLYDRFVQQWPEN